MSSREGRELPEVFEDELTFESECKDSCDTGIAPCFSELRSMAISGTDAAWGNWRDLRRKSAIFFLNMVAICDLTAHEFQ